MTKPSSKRVPVPLVTIDVPNAPSDLPDPRRLHEATDRLNESLVNFEQTLGELNLGVSGSVTLEEDDRSG